MPTSQSSSTGSCEPTTSCSVRNCGMRGGVTAIQCWGLRSSSVATSRIWVASRGYRGQRCPQVAPRGRRADVGEPDCRPPALGACRRGPLHDDLAGIEASGRGDDEQRARRRRGGGSRYHAERSTAGCWVPLRQLPITGVRAGSRLYGSRAREPLTPAAVVVPPSVPASLALTVPVSVSAKLAAPGFSITGSAETSLGMPLGPKPSAVTAPSASADRHARWESAARRWGPVRPSRRWPARRSCR